MNLIYHLLCIFIQCIYWQYAQGQEIGMEFCLNSTLEGNELFPLAN